MMHNQLLSLAVLGTTLLAATSPAQSTLYVSLAGGLDTNSGTTRLQPLQNLRTALARAHANLAITEIRLTSGTHLPGSGRASPIPCESTENSAASWPALCRSLLG